VGLVTDQHRIEQLARVAVFAGLTPDALDLLAEIATE